MPSTACTETIEAFLAVLQGLAPDNIRPFLTEDIRWWWPQSAVDHGFITTRCQEGREAVLATIAQAADKSFQRIQLKLLHLVEDGDLVAAHAAGAGEMHSGKDYANEYHYLFRFVDDRIAECWYFQDTAYAFSRIS